MRVPLASAALVVVLVGCAGNYAESSTTEPPPEQECTPQIRLEGVIYRGVGYTDGDANEFGTADEAECHDEAAYASGPVFGDDPRQVEVSKFPGYSPDEVLGVRFTEDSFSIFVAETVSAQDSARILDELSGSLQTP